MTAEDFRVLLICHGMRNNVYRNTTKFLKCITINAT